MEKNSEKAFEYFQKSAEQNYIDAFMKIGYFYLLGWAVQRSPELAIKNFKLALEGGLHSAFYGLGQAHNMLGDSGKALEFFVEGKRLGDMDCIYELAKMYEMNSQWEKALQTYILASLNDEEGYAALKAAFLILNHSSLGDTCTARTLLVKSRDNGQKLAKRTLAELFGEDEEMGIASEEEEDNGVDVEDDEEE